jgi:hypothetical protein
LQQLESDATTVLLDGTLDSRAEAEREQAIDQAMSTLRRLAAALPELDRRIAAAQVDQHVARVHDQRRQALAVFQHAAELRAQVAPLLDQIEALEGVLFYNAGCRSNQVERQANNLLLHAEELEFKLPADVRAAIEAERETSPNEVDQALHRIQYPQAHE